MVGALSRGMIAFAAVLAAAGSAWAQSVVVTGTVTPTSPAPAHPWNLTGAGVDIYTGTLTISGGGTVTSDLAGNIGVDPGDVGTATVTGAGSSWTGTGDLSVGRSGQGTLLVSNGGAVINEYGDVGDQAGAVGTATVTGANSVWTNNSDLRVGTSGQGTLLVENAGRVESAESYLGYLAGSVGTATITGAGSTWATSGFLYVGAEGQGSLRIENGGRATAVDVIMGSESGSSGSVTVTGSGSAWNVNDNMIIGYRGQGDLVVSNGGAVRNSSAFVAFCCGSGTVRVTGANSTWTSTDLNVGYIGTGTLDVADGGTVSSTVLYLGYDATGTGIVSITGASSTLRTTNGQVSVGYDGQGTLTVSNGGTLVANNGTGIVHLAERAGSTGTLNIGAAAGATAVAAGTVSASEIRFGAGTGTLTFNHTSSNYVFSTTITGNGTINQLGGTTVLAGDLSGFTGTATISGGTFRVNTRLSASVSILSGATLGGSGTVGNVTLASGATIAPGNSIGTLTVAGNLTFASGSTYQVEVNPTGTDSDLITVTGTATLNGASVVHVGNTGLYSPTSTYTILTAVGGVIGTFGQVSSNFAFLDATLGYTTNAVTLTLKRNNTNFSAIAATPNQAATGGAIETLGFGNSLYNTMLGFDAATARRAFDQLSGEVHGSIQTALIEDSRHLRDAAGERVRAAFDASGDVGIWGKAYGSWTETDGDGNAAALTHNSGGLLFGADTMLGDNGRLGAVIGYGRSVASVGERNSRADSDNYSVGLYGGGRWGGVTLSGGAAYSWHEIDTDRTASFTGVNQRLQSDYRSGTAQIFGEAGYVFDIDGLALEPFAGLAYVNHRAGSFAESGGSVALTSGGSINGVTLSTFGLRAEHDFRIGDMGVRANGMLGWRHVFGDGTPEASLAFNGSSTFLVEGAPLARDAAVLSAGFDLDLSSNASLSFDYVGQLGNGFKDHGARARLAIRF